MIHKIINIDKYHWRVQVFLNSKEKDSEEILLVFQKLNTRQDQLQRAAKHLQKTIYNGGMTYSSPELHESVLVIGQADSAEEVINTFSHELRHLVDDIAAVYNIASGFKPRFLLD